MSKPTLSPSLREAAWRAAAAVADPEIPVLTIDDLGILRNVEIAQDGSVEVTITPTYSGCPAMALIAIEVELALARAGMPKARVLTVLSPAWTTEWISEDGRRKLRDNGIAPPPPRGSDRPVTCPLCGSGETECLAAFGSTACKAIWRCRSCREPFDHFKCH